MDTVFEEAQSKEPNQISWRVTAVGKMNRRAGSGWGGLPGKRNCVSQGTKARGKRQSIKWVEGWARRGELTDIVG